MRRFLLLCLLCTMNSTHGSESWHYLDNGQVRLGVNLKAGACIGWFSKSGTQENLLNAYDVGRYVQQSYYGNEDGSDWNGKPWRYNPVQGGSWKNEPAEVVETQADATSFYAKTKPRHWATGAFTPECMMEEWLRLDGGLARLKFKMTYTGTQEHKPRHQELPALFVTPQRTMASACLCHTRHKSPATACGTATRAIAAISLRSRPSHSSHDWCLNTRSCS
jgi:hypothetical protein